MFWYQLYVCVQTSSLQYTLYCISFMQIILRCIHLQVILVRLFIYCCVWCWFFRYHSWFLHRPGLHQWWGGGLGTWFPQIAPLLSHTFGRKSKRGYKKVSVHAFVPPSAHRPSEPYRCSNSIIAGRICSISSFMEPSWPADVQRHGRCHSLARLGRGFPSGTQVMRTD